MTKFLMFLAHARHEPTRATHHIFVHDNEGFRCPREAEKRAQTHFWSPWTSAAQGNQKQAHGTHLPTPRLGCRYHCRRLHLLHCNLLLVALCLICPPRHLERTDLCCSSLHVVHVRLSPLLLFLLTLSNQTVMDSAAGRIERGVSDAAVRTAQCGCATPTDR